MLDKLVFRWALVGFIGGAASTTFLLAWFAMAPSVYFPLRVAHVVACTAFWGLNHIYEGFPTSLSVLETDLLLVLLAGTQWAVIGLLVAVVKLKFGFGHKLRAASRPH